MVNDRMRDWLYFPSFPWLVISGEKVTGAVNVGTLEYYSIISLQTAYKGELVTENQ